MLIMCLTYVICLQSTLGFELRKYSGLDLPVQSLSLQSEQTNEMFQDIYQFFR